MASIIGALAFGAFPDAWERNKTSIVVGALIRGIGAALDGRSGVRSGKSGETTTGENGHVLRTTNFGESWEILPLPTQPNATMWGLATHPADANRIVAFSLFGEVYVTEDAGASWRKIAREFGEIRAAAWVPN